VLTFTWDFEGMALRSSRYMIDYIRN